MKITNKNNHDNCPIGGNRVVLTRYRNSISDDDVHLDHVRDHAQVLQLTLLELQ